MKKQKASLNGMKFGIEIEVSNFDFNLAKNKIVNSGDLPGWKVVTDCSVNDGCEIVSPPMHYNPDTLVTIRKVLNRIKQFNGTADESTGAHIHVEFTGNSKQVKHLVKEFYAKQALLFDALNVDEMRQAEFCRKLPAHLVSKVKGTKNQVILDTLEAYQYISKLGITEYRARYFALNLQALSKHNTVEFRLFNGTLNFAEWLANIQLSLAICNRAKRAKRSSDRPKKYNPLTARYDMRTWLLRLGFIGKDYESARQIFRESLPIYHEDGVKADTAWRYGRHSRDMAGNVPELNG